MSTATVTAAATITTTATTATQPVSQQQRVIAGCIVPLLGPRTLAADQRLQMKHIPAAHVHDVHVLPRERDALVHACVYHLLRLHHGLPQLAGALRDAQGGACWRMTAAAAADKPKRYALPALQLIIPGAAHQQRGIAPKVDACAPTTKQQWPALALPAQEAVATTATSTTATRCGLSSSCGSAASNPTTPSW
jgi:hypothetical protein